MDKKLLGLFVLSIFAIFSIALIAADIPTDAQIAKIVMDTNNGEIELAKLAKEKAQDKQVKKFANEMIKAHSKNNRKSVKMTQKIKEEPSESAMSGQVQSDAKSEMAELEKLNGPDFDKAYINSQVTMHEKVLADLDSNLIPNAKNRKLKKMLTKTRSEVAKHLEHAQHLQSTLK